MFKLLIVLLWQLSVKSLVTTSRLLPLQGKQFNVMLRTFGLYKVLHFQSYMRAIRRVIMIEYKLNGIHIIHNVLFIRGAEYYCSIVVYLNVTDLVGLDNFHCLFL